jgi:hypothetical protein
MFTGDEMMRLGSAIVVRKLVLSTLLLLAAGRSPAFSAPQSLPPGAIAHALPVVFEPNHGQAPQDVLYQARTEMGKMLLTADGLTMIDFRDGKPRELKLRFPGSTSSLCRGESPTGGRANYYTGRDKSRWITGVPLYGMVRYPQIYPGVDLLFHGSAGRLEYDFEVEPRKAVDPLQVDLGDPANLRLDQDGNLLVNLDGSQFQLLAPVAYQQSGAERLPVQVAYKMLGDHRIGFAVGAYDHDKKLVIDPVVTYGNLLPANAGGTISGAAVDTEGNLIVTGSGSEGVLVTKIDPTGEKILYFTYIAAGQFFSVSGIAVDSQGSPYIIGSTENPDFPLTSVTLGTCGGSICNAGFALKLDSTGALSYSTLLSSGQILPKAIVVDKVGDAHIAGLAADGSLQTVNAFQAQYPGGLCTECDSAFFLELNANGTGLVQSSYLGTQIYATAIALDSSGNIYVAGPVASPYTPSVPLKHEFQSAMGGEFLTEFSSDGSTLLFGSFLGGDNEGQQYADTVAGLAIASDGSVYLGGSTYSLGFPYTLNGYRLPNESTYYQQMFAIAFTPSVTGVKYSTYLGDGNMTAMAADAEGHFYAAGSMYPSPRETLNAVVSDSSSSSMFLELDATGKPVQVSEFGGHIMDSVPSAMAVDVSGNIYLAGNLSGANGILPNGCLPEDPVIVGAAAYITVTAAATSCTGVAGNAMAFIAKISPAPAPQISLGDTLPFLPLHNVGSADLHIKQIAFSGGLKKIGGNCGPTVPAGKSCVLTLTDANGEFAQGSVTITSDASPSVQTFTPYGGGQAVGSAVGDLLWVDTSQLSFAGQEMGLASAPRPVQIWNLGMTTLNQLSVNTYGGLSQTGTCPTSLPPGASCTAEFTWTPANGLGSPTLSVNADGSYLNTYFVPGEATASGTALVLSLPNAIPFGTQTVGHSAFSRAVTVTNVSNSAVAVPSVSVAGGTGGFSLTGSTCKGELQPQQTCAVAVNMSSKTAGSLSSNLHFTGSLSASVSLWGSVQSSAAVSLSPGDLQWPAVLVGESATQSVKVSNLTAASISLSQISFALPDYSQTNNCGGVIAKLSSCTITVKFTPTQTGERADTMTLTFGGSLPAQTVSIDGVGKFELELSAPSLDFGLNNIVGKLSVPISVTLRNLTSKAQSYVLYTSVPFVFTSTCANPLPALSSCAFSVSFRPMSVGEFFGTLTVIGVGATTAKQIPLGGSSYTPPSIQLSASQLLFYSLKVGTSTLLQLNLTNTGSRQANISGFTITGSAAKDFSVPANYCVPLGGEASCWIEVEFKPTTVGIRSATLTISSDATNGPQTVSLSGIGQ